MTMIHTPGKPLHQLLCGALILLPLALSAPVHAAGDPVKGGDVFNAECSDCHSVKAGKDKKGPSLFGVVGRPAGTVVGMNYSDAMRASKLTWTPDRLDAYLAKPKAVVPNGKMKYEGLDDAKARADVIAYLVQQK